MARNDLFTPVVVKPTNGKIMPSHPIASGFQSPTGALPVNPPAVAESIKGGNQDFALQLLARKSAVNPDTWNVALSNPDKNPKEPRNPKNFVPKSNPRGF